MQGVRAIAAAGAGGFIEIGPRATLLTLVRRTLGEEAGVMGASLRPTCDDMRQMLDSLGALYVDGLAAAERAFTGANRRRHRRDADLSLPTRTALDRCPQAGGAVTAS